MKLISFKLNRLFFILLSMGIISCTDLQEKVVDEVLGSETQSADPQSAIAAAYGQLGDGTFVDHGNVFALQEYSTDEAILPTRGSDWGDGGKWRALSEFTWDASNSQVKTVWDNLNFGITKSLTAISAISNNTGTDSNKDLFLAEAKGLLAFYTYHTLDLYGQAPYRDPMDINAKIVVRKADVAIDELIKDVETILPQLADIGTQSTHVGRFTKQAAYALLADMYMNRAVFKNRYGSSFDFNEKSLDGNNTDMDKVIEYSSILINSGYFKLESNFFHNFDISNDDGTELIFAVVQKISTLRNSSNSFAYMPVERSQKASPDNRGTNATSTTPEFYHSWDGNHDDPRFHRHYQYKDGTWFMNDGTDVSVPATSLVDGTGKPWFHFNRGIQEGVQYGPTILANKNFDMTTDGRIKVHPLVMEKNTNLAVNFTPELNFDNPMQAVLSQSQINRGARVFKYEFDPGNGDNSTSNVNISLFRLGGIYTLRAEAYFRKGNTSAALSDINTLRTSRTREALYDNAPGLAISSLDASTLVKEIAFETYWELVRRKQLIRFGKFEDARTAKQTTSPFRRVYPIPQAAIDASNVFTQNEGY